MRYLRQSTSVDVPIGPFLDDTDGKTAESGLTITQPDVRLKKNNGDWAQKAAAQTLTHEENGFYELTLDATDTATLGLLRVAVFEAGALPVWEDFMVMPANVWDSLFSSDALQVHAVEISNGLITAAAIATDAIDADALATDAVAEIAAGLGVEIVCLGPVGDIDPGATIDIKFLTIKAGVLTTLAGTPAVLVYKDNSLTQSAATGITLTADFDGVTGLNNLRIATGADGAFYAAGSNFQPYLSAGTVGGTSVVGRLLSPFSIHARSPLRPTTTGETITVNPDGSVDASGGYTPEDIADEVATRSLIVGTVTDKVNYELSAGGVVAVWSAANRALTDKADFTLSTTGIDAILDRQITEPATVFGWASASLRSIIGWLGARASNTQTQTATTTTVMNRANDCALATATVSDNGTTATRGSFS